jgi:S-adenosylmethionine decarboxylase
MFPERQPSPHRHWTDEVGFLDGIFANGAAYTVGKVNGDHWLLYLTCPPECDEIPPAQRLASQQPATNPTSIDSAPPDFTIEILMSDLSSDNCRPFFLKEDGSAVPPDHAQRLSSTLGISDIFPPHLTTLDAYSFSPCGYSANAIIRWGDTAITDDTNDVKNTGSYQNIEGYYTIHVTPEEGASYASFECNVPLLTSTSPPSSSASHLRLAESIPDLHTLIQRVVGIFRPGRLSLTLFISSDSGADVGDDNGDTAVEAAQRTFKAALTTCISKAASDSGDMEIQHSYYKRTDKINYEFGGYDLAFASFELLHR